ncbi:hypothetical protein PoB_003522400 [Plakobranchus ocellatus]|uniref:Uncharacterized protein n=1 Tax=Plakobranchus ocellatus TaxID=259542 RepID=A0AAV4ALU4_9GAST|nr:hypothetical protein PoB_003522400 [Plakobranchus ocellatus]
MICRVASSVDLRLLCSTQRQVSLIICVTRLASWFARQRNNIDLGKGHVSNKCAALKIDLATPGSSLEQTRYCFSEPRLLLPPEKGKTGSGQRVLMSVLGYHGSRKNLEPASPQQDDRSFQALRQARAPVAGTESATEGSVQISGQIRYPLCHLHPLNRGP